MAEKQYNEMTDDELREAMTAWGVRVDNAAGWPSAYFAAKQCEAIAKTASRRGFAIENRWPIVRG